MTKKTFNFLPEIEFSAPPLQDIETVRKNAEKKHMPDALATVKIVETKLRKV